jgi:hypothetical protein
MPCDVFDKRKPLFLNTNASVTGPSALQCTMDGQLLAPRKSKDEYHYRRLGYFLEILQIEHDCFLEIKEAMDSLKDLHEFRRQSTFKTVDPPQTEYSFKPVKNRPPIPAKLLSLRELMAHGPCSVTFTFILQKCGTTSNVSIRILFSQPAQVAANLLRRQQRPLPLP